MTLESDRDPGARNNGGRHRCGPIVSSKPREQTSRAGGRDGRKRERQDTANAADDGTAGHRQSCNQRRSFGRGRAMKDRSRHRHRRSRREVSVKQSCPSQTHRAARMARRAHRPRAVLVPVPVIARRMPASVSASLKSRKAQQLCSLPTISRTRSMTCCAYLSSSLRSSRLTPSSPSRANSAIHASRSR